MYLELSNSTSNQPYILPEFLSILSASSTWFDEPSSVNSLWRIELYCKREEHSQLPFRVFGRKLPCRKMLPVNAYPGRVTHHGSIPLAENFMWFCFKRKNGNPVQTMPRTLNWGFLKIWKITGEGSVYYCIYPFHARGSWSPNIYKWLWTRKFLQHFFNCRGVVVEQIFDYLLGF